MESVVLETAVSQGIWAVLAVFLLIYVAKSNEKRDLRQEEREAQYQQMLADMTAEFSVLSDIKADVTEIKEYIHQIKSRPEG